MQVAQRVDVLLCDLASALLPAAEGQLDLLVSTACWNELCNCFPAGNTQPGQPGQVDLPVSIPCPAHS